MCNSACLVHKLKSSTDILFKCLLQTNVVFRIIIFLKEGLTPALLPLTLLCLSPRRRVPTPSTIIFNVTELRIHPLPSIVLVRYLHWIIVTGQHFTCISLHQQDSTILMYQNLIVLLSWSTYTGCQPPSCGRSFQIFTSLFHSSHTQPHPLGQQIDFVETFKGFQYFFI